jgi:proteasome lid subunit RPN8/RPN11
MQSIPDTRQPLVMSHQHYDAICHHLLRNAPDEACGLLGGIARRVMAVYPIENVARNPGTEYRCNPVEQIEVLGQLERKGWVLVAIFHSHPPGQRSDPSPTDIARAMWPEALQLIAVLDGHGGFSSFKAFALQSAHAVEIPIVVVSGPEVRA